MKVVKINKTKLKIINVLFVYTNSSLTDDSSISPSPDSMVNVDVEDSSTTSVSESKAYISGVKQYHLPK